MKICISEKSIKDFVKIFKAEAALLKKDSSLTKDQIYKSLYNAALAKSDDVKDQHNKDVALQHMLFIPVALNGVIDSIQPDVALDLAKTMSALNNPTAVSDLIKSYQDLITATIDVEENPIEFTEPALNFDQSIFDAAHYEILTNQDGEYTGKQKGEDKTVDPAKASAFNFIRSILNNILNEDVEHKVLATTLKSITEYARENNLLIDNSMVSVLKNPNSMVFAMTDENGTIISDNGKIVLFNTYTSSTEKLFENYKHGEDRMKMEFATERLKNAHAALTKAYSNNGAISEEEASNKAKAKIIAELDEVKRISQAVTESKGKGFLLNVNKDTSNFGYVQKNSGFQSQTKSIKDISKFSLTSESVKDENGKEIYKFFGLTGHTLHTTPVSLYPNTLDSDMVLVNTLIDLLTNPELKLGSRTLNETKRKELFSKYVNVADKTAIKFKKDGTISVGNQNFKINDAELKPALLNYFTKFQAKEKVDITGMDSPKIITSLSEATNDKEVFKTASGEYYSLYKPKFSFAIKPENKYTVSGNTLTVTPVTHEEHIISNSYTNAELGKNNELRLYHPRIGFMFDRTTSVETNIEEEDKPGFTFDDVELLASNAIELETVSSKAEQAAVKWFNDSPLSKVLSLDVTDKKHPHALAQWFTSGITLYQGSNNTLIYHEAWHAFTQGILTKSEKDKLYAEVRKNYPSESFNTNKDVEEFLAEKFRAYAMDKVMPKGNAVQKFFKNLFESLKNLFANKSLSDKYFQQLVSGKLDIASYNPNANMYWGRMNANIFAINSDAPLKSISAAQSKLILDTVNTLVNEAYSEKIKQRYFKVKDISEISDLYKVALYKLNQIKEAKNAELDALTAKQNKSPEEKMKFSELSSQVEALVFAIAEFGDVSEIGNNISESSENKGVIGAHITRGSFINESDLNKLLNEEDVQDESDPFKERKNISLGEYADNEILLLLGTVPDFDSKNNPILNGLGVNVLSNKVKVLMKLGKLLMSQPNEEAMFNAMINSKDRIIQEVIQRMPVDGQGNPRMDLTSQLLWSKFFQTFNKSNMPLRQLLFERVNDGNKVEIKPKYGNVSSSTTQVDRDWSGAFENTPFVKTDIHGSYLDVKAALDWIDTHKDATPAEKFNAIGINITDNDVINGVLFNGDPAHNVKPGLLSEFIDRLRLDKSVQTTDFTNRINGVMDIIKDYSINEIVNEEEVLTPVKGLRGFYNTIKEVEFMHSDNYNSFMGTNAEGETASELVLNSSITHMVNNINAAGSLETLTNDLAFEFLNPELDPFKKANNWMNQLFDDKGARIKMKNGSPVKINYENFSGTKFFEQFTDDRDFISTIERGLSNMALDKDSKFITDVYLSYFGKSEVPRMADKSSSFHFGLQKGDNVPMFTAQDLVDVNNDPSSSYVMYDALKGYLAAEIVRINTLKNATGNIDKAYKKRGGKFFIFDDLISEKTKGLVSGIESTNYEEVLAAIGKHEDDISLDINNYFKSKTDKTYQNNANSFFLPKGMMSELNVNSREKATYILMGMYERNKFMHNLDFTTMFLGDPALYNVEKNDFHKRIAGIISTGESFRHDKWMLGLLNGTENKSRGLAAAKVASGEIKLDEPFRTYDGTVNTAIINDHETPSEYLAELEKVIPGSTGPYQNMNEADGQGFVSFDFYRMLSISQGLWSPIKEAMYNNIVKDVAYDQTKVSEFFESMKLQYYGPIKSDVLGGVAFHKFNLIPLIPSMIKGTKLETLHNKMMEQGIDYMTFASGSKLSVISNTDNEGSADNFYNQDRTVNEGTKFVKNTIHVKYLKNQIKIHNEFKGKVTLPTQMRTILYAGLMSGGIPTDVASKYDYNAWSALSEQEKANASDNYKWVLKYEQALTDIAEFKRQELFNELGITEEADISKSSEKLAKLIRSELTRSEIEEAHIDFLFNNNALKQDISMSVTYAQVEKMLVSLIDKRMTKIKVNGEGLIQMASTMSEKKDSQWKKATTEEQMKYGTNGLSSYYKADGKIQGMEIKIALQGDFEKLLYIKGKDGKSIATYVEKTDKAGKKQRVLNYDETLAKLNELLANETWRKENKQLLTLTTSRIPGQAMNSLEFMVIKEFLPKQAGNIIMVPSEMVAKSGSDFDVDKLFTMMPNLALINGKVETIKKTVSEDVNELKSNLSAARKELKAKKDSYYATLNENNDILSQVPNIKELRETVKEFREISETYDWDNLSKAERTEKINLDREIKAMDAQLSEIMTTLGIKNKAQSEVTALEETIGDLERRINGQSVKGLENNLIDVIVERLERADNYPDLVRPNSNDLVDIHAEALEQTVSSFDSYGVVHSETRKHSKNKKKNVISETMIFDPAYNINKQIENAVGMDTLGIGAVINKYYSMFTRIGMYTNIDSNELTIDQYEKLLAKKKRTKAEQLLLDEYVNYKLHFPNFNKKVVGSKEVVDLSALHNNAGEYIPDILGQMINGWVDVAKDGWIFNIQGNKEAAPTLEYLFMAGVPVEDAVYFMSLPIIRKYLDVKRKQAGALFALNTANALDPKATNILVKYQDVDAYKEVVAGLDLQKHEDFKKYMLNPRVESLQPVLKKVTLDSKVINMKDVKEHVLNGKTMSDDEQLELLNKFVMYNTLSSQITALTTATTFDTKASSKLSEVREKKNKFDRLNDNMALPENIKGMILDHSAVGPFESLNMITKLFSNFGMLRNNKALISKALAGRYDAKELGIKLEDHIESYQDEFLSYLYQNEYNRFDASNLNGFEVVSDSSIPKYEFENGVLKYNPSFIHSMIANSDNALNQLNHKFESTNAVLKYLTIFENLKDETFDKKSMHYILAEKALAADVDAEITRDTYEEFGLSADDFEQMIQTAAVESKALLLSGNKATLMKGPFSYAKRMLVLVETNGDLKGKFDILKDLRHNYSKNSDNLLLSNIKAEGYSKIYKEDLEVLKEFAVPEIQELFNQFDRFATLQSGVKFGGKFSMASIIDPAHVSNTIGSEYNIINNYLQQASQGKIANYGLLDLYNEMYYGGNLQMKIWSRKRGSSFENDAYFNPEAVEGGTVSLSDMPTATEYDRLVAKNGNKAIVFPTENLSEVSDKQYDHYDALANELLNTDAEEHDSFYVATPSEEITEEEYKRLLPLYTEQIKKSAAVDTTTFVFKTDKFLDGDLMMELHHLGYWKHLIINSTGAFYKLTKQNSMNVDGLYNTQGKRELVGKFDSNSTELLTNSVDRNVAYNIAKKYGFLDEYNVGNEKTNWKQFTADKAFDLKEVESLYLHTVSLYASKNPKFKDAIIATENDLLTAEDVSNPLNNYYALALMKVRNQLNVKPVLVLPAHIIDKTLKNSDGTKRYASTNGTTIRLNPAESVDEFFDYFQGVEGGITSKQKALVLTSLEEQGWSIANIKSLLNTPELINSFLVLHEQDHIDHNDKAVYYAQSKTDFLTPDKIAIEARASINALLKLGGKSSATGNEFDNGKIGC